METKQKLNLNKAKLSKEIDKIVNNNFTVDLADDQSFLKDSNSSWDELENLKNELGNNIINFVYQVNSLINSSEIVNNLGDKKEHFNKTVELFFMDINRFSHKVKEVRMQHDGKTGPVTSMDDFNTYNRIAITYQSLFTELISLISPTIANLILTSTEAVNELKAQKPTKEIKDDQP